MASSEHPNHLFLLIGRDLLRSVKALALHKSAVLQAPVYIYTPTSYFTLESSILVKHDSTSMLFRNSKYAILTEAFQNSISSNKLFLSMLDHKNVHHDDFGVYIF